MVIALVWSLSLTFSLPLALYQQVEWIKDTSEYTCNENWPDIKWVRVYTLASLSLQYLLPCSVISVCYSRVYSALNRRSKNKRHMRQRRKVSVDRPASGAKDADAAANAGADDANEEGMICGWLIKRFTLKYFLSTLKTKSQERLFGWLVGILFMFIGSYCCYYCWRCWCCSCWCCWCCCCWCCCCLKLTT